MVRIGTAIPRPSTTPHATRSPSRTPGTPGRRRRIQAMPSTHATIPNASDDPISMFHQSELIPCAALAASYPPMLHVRSGYPGRAALLIGLVAIVAADVAPLDHRFSVHMAQHLVLGDVGPLCVVVGLRGRLRLAHPAVALPLWAASLVVWHLSGPYDAALRHVWLHQLQHLCFAAAGLAV